MGVTDRSQGQDVWRQGHPKRLQPPAGSRVHGEDNGIGQLLQPLQNAAQPASIIGVLLPMNRHQIEVARQIQGLQGQACGLAHAREDIGHHVAHDLDAFGDPLPAKILSGESGRTEEKRRDVIGEAPVDLFRHLHVETAQTGLDMGHWNIELGRGQGSGQRGVRISEHHHHRGLHAAQLRLDRAQHGPRHGAMRAPGNPKMDLGLGNTEFTKERP